MAPTARPTLSWRAGVLTGQAYVRTTPLTRREAYMDIVIHEDDIVLRNWNINDANELSTIGNDSSIAFNLNDGFPYPYTKDKAVIFIKNAISSTNLLLAIVKNDRIVGSIGAFYDDTDKSKAVIAYFIGKEYWNQGYGTKAVKGIVEYLIKEKEIKTILADPFERNNGSRKVLEKNGFKLGEIVTNGSTKSNKPINICKYEYKILF
jgi:RimJ/RimL family protein N-acetyltransferase